MIQQEFREITEIYDIFPNAFGVEGTAIIAVNLTVQARYEAMVKDKMMKLHLRKTSGYDVMTGELNIVWSINASNALRRAGVDQETVTAARNLQMESKMAGGRGGGRQGKVATARRQQGTARE